ncbi:MAG TPA: hypothetical protein VIO11_00275, partial [Candidatus Methanoperedens sp.]
MNLLKNDKAQGANLRFIIFVLIILSSMAIVMLYIDPIRTLTEEKKTSGNLTFIDGRGNPIAGTMEISISGTLTDKRPKVNSITWNDVPNAKISFDALESANFSVSLVISGDSPQGRITIEDFGVINPTIIAAPGVSMKYLKINPENVYFTEASISIRYTDGEIEDLNEKSLSIYGFDGESRVWRELPTTIFTGENRVSAKARSLGILAVAAKRQENTKVRNAGGLQIIDLFKTPDRNSTLKKKAVSITVSGAQISDNGIFEADASKDTGVAVRLKLKTPHEGKINIEDFGRNNPVGPSPPGKVIKYVNISAASLELGSAEVMIYYSDEEIGGMDENALGIYHWNGASWEPLKTSVDSAGNVLTATATSLSPFAASAGEGGAERILIATNRFVILDDPKRTGARSASGFTLPVYHYSTWSYWANKTT